MVKTLDINYSEDLVKQLSPQINSTKVKYYQKLEALKEDSYKINWERIGEIKCPSAVSVYFEKVWLWTIEIVY
jgi:hypothetical protein